MASKRLTRGPNSQPQRKTISKGDCRFRASGLHPPCHDVRGKKRTSRLSLSEMTASRDTPTIAVCYLAFTSMGVDGVHVRFGGPGKHSQ